METPKDKCLTKKSVKHHDTKGGVRGWGVKRTIGITMGFLGRGVLITPQHIHTSSSGAAQPNPLHIRVSVVHFLNLSSPEVRKLGVVSDKMRQTYGQRQVHHPSCADHSPSNRWCPGKIPFLSVSVPCSAVAASITC